MRKTALASFVGTLIEWYDFFIFGTAAALVFGPIFFSDLGETGGVLAAFATFGVGFVARPVGAIVFGHFGDRIGRKRMLIVSLLMMGTGTVVVGLLPTYDSIGIVAPVLLVVCRLLQGFAVGGEWGGAVLMAVEHAPPGKKAFYGSFPQLSVPFGLMLSTLTFLAVRQLPEEAFLSWGWRIPFLASIVLIAVGLYIRLNILESPEFSKTKDEGKIVKLPIGRLLKTQWRRVLVGIASTAAPNIPFYLTTVFVISYGASDAVGLSADFMLWALMAAAFVEAITIPVVAVYSDRIGPRTMLMAGSVFCIGFGPLFFLAVDTAVPALVILSMCVALGVAHATTYSPSAGFLSELFPPDIRYTGTSLTYHFGGAVTSGPVPLVAASLVAWAGNTTPLAIYIMAGGLLTLLALLAVPSDRPGKVREREAAGQEKAGSTL